MSWPTERQVSTETVTTAQGTEVTVTTTVNPAAVESVAGEEPSPGPD